MKYHMYTYEESSESCEPGFPLTTIQTGAYDGEIVWGKQIDIKVVKVRANAGDYGDLVSQYSKLYFALKVHSTCLRIPHEHIVNNMFEWSTEMEVIRLIYVHNTN